MISVSALYDVRVRRKTEKCTGRGRGRGGGPVERLKSACTLPRKFGKGSAQNDTLCSGVQLRSLCTMFGLYLAIRSCCFFRFEHIQFEAEKSKAEMAEQSELRHLRLRMMSGRSVELPFIPGAQWSDVIWSLKRGLDADVKLVDSDGESVRGADIVCSGREVSLAVEPKRFDVYGQRQICAEELHAGTQRFAEFWLHLTHNRGPEEDFASEQKQGGYPCYKVKRYWGGRLCILRK